MGYYAESEWYVKITGDMEKLADALSEYVLTTDDMTSVDVVEYAASECNEDAEIKIEDGVLSGWGGGKMLSLASNDVFWKTLSTYAEGTIDWRSSDGYWRVRLYGDGTFQTFDGEVVYSEDRNT